MSTKVGSIHYDLNLNDKGFIDGLNNAKKSINDVSAKMQNAGKQMQNAGKKMTMAVTAPIVAAGVMGINLAMELEATEAKYKTVFQGMTDVSDKFIKDFQKLTPATTAEARSMASGIQDLLVPMGFARKEATNLTGKTMHLAGALTNFNNATHTAEDVTSAFQSALTGMYRPLKSLGIDTEKAAVMQKAMAMTGKTNEKQITRQEEALALIEIAYENSTDALAAYNEESLDAKTKLGLATKGFQDMVAELMYVMLPLIDKVSDKIRQLTKWLKNLTPEQQKMILIFAAIAAAIGPVLWILGKLVSSVGVLIPLFASPVFWIVAAILVVIAGAAYLVYKNWDRIKDILLKVWEVIKPILMPVLESMWEFLKEIWKTIKELWKGIEAWLIPILKVLAAIIGGVLLIAIGLLIGFIGRMIKGFEYTLKIIQWVIGKFKEASDAAFNLGTKIGEGIRTSIDWVKDLWNNIKDYVNKIKNKFSEIRESIKSAFSISGIGGAMKGFLGKLGVPGFARGVTNFGGGLAVVGEQGPELVNLPRGSDVIPNGKFGGSNITMNINLSGVMASGRADLRMVAKDLVESINEELRAKGIMEMGVA